MNFGRRKAETRTYDSLNHVIQEVVSLLEHALPAGIQVRLDLDPEVPPVLMDASQIHQVVMNLAINARDALGGTGLLTLRTGREHLDAEGILDALVHAGPHAYLEVEDDGAGIPEELQRRIFEPFFTTKEPGKGTGLGLSVVRRIVEDHRGLLRCRSAPGAGTTFRILLPLQGAAAVPTIVGLLDDPGRDRAALQAFLESEGLSVLAADHWEALRSCSVILVHAEALIDGLGQAVELQAHAPRAKLLIASRNSHLDPKVHGLPILPYPYEAAGILQALREVFT
jgi:C4-dicarboxylate-specific signal transduction histidine kinase